MSNIGYKVTEGILRQPELLLFDLDNPIPKPIGGAPPFVLLERIPTTSKAQAVIIACQRRAVPIPEQE